MSSDDKNMEEKSEKGKVVPPFVADHLIKTVKFYAPQGTMGELYTYDNSKGVYVVAKPLVSHYVSDTLGGKSTKHFDEEVLYNIKSKVFNTRNVAEPPLNLVPIKNGLFNIDTMKLEPFSSDYFVTSTLPVDFKEGADCPLFKKFLGDVVPEDAVALAQEVFGWSLFRNYRHQKAVMLQGGGENGKSTLLAVLRMFLGVENISSVSLQDLSTNRFAKASLYHKLANIYPDLPSGNITESGDFKALTGGDLIDAENKFKDRFRFVNYAKLIFSGNKMPRFSNDESVALYRRWIIIVFPNAFPVGDPRRDDKILEKVTTADELSGILNWALEGLKRLLEKCAFSYPKSTEEIRIQYDRLGDSAKAFCNECLEYDPMAEKMDKEFLMLCYETFCRKNNLIAKDKMVFFRNLKKYMPDIQTSKQQFGEPPVTLYYVNGIALVDKEEEEEIDELGSLG